MKRIIIFIWIFIVAISCEKTEINNLETKHFSDEIVFKTKSSKDLKTAKHKSEEAFDYLTDDQDKKIDKYLYHLALATRELTKDKYFNDLVVRLSQDNDFKLIYLGDLFKEAKDYKDKIQAELSKSKSKYKKNKDLVLDEESFDIIAEDFTRIKKGKIQQYAPAIYFINRRIANPALQPIVSAGLYVNSDRFPEQDEYIFAWKIREDGSFEEIVINEEEAFDITNPIFILDNAELNRYKKHRPPMMKSDSLPTLKSISTTYEFHSCEYRINERYEDIGNSDFCIAGAMVNSCTEWIDFLESGVDPEDNPWIQLSSVAPSNIGEDMENWNHISDNYTPYYSVFAFWNTFERDWAQSEKYLGVGNSQISCTWEIFGKMKWSDEWYTFDPGEVYETNIPPLDYSYIFNNWCKWYHSADDKGYLVIWRCDI